MGGMRAESTKGTSNRRQKNGSWPDIKRELACDSLVELETQKHGIMMKCTLAVILSLLPKDSLKRMPDSKVPSPDRL
jgi:hypothetical protein